MRYSSPVSDAAYLYKNAKTKILLHTHTHTHIHTQTNKTRKQNKTKIKHAYKKIEGWWLKL